MDAGDRVIMREEFKKLSRNLSAQLQILHQNILALSRDLQIVKMRVGSLMK